jgi:hypothetical protein
MRSESTSALGQPKLTKPILGEPILGEPILGEPIFGGLLFDGEIGMGVLIGKRGTLVCHRLCLKPREHEGSENAETCRQRADGPRGAAFWLLWSLAFVLMVWAVSPGRTLQDALAAELLQGHLANASAAAKCRGRLPEVAVKMRALALSGPAQFDVRTDC